MRLVLLFSLFLCFIRIDAQEREKLNRLLVRLQEPAADSDRVKDLINVARTYQRMGLYDSSLTYIRKGISLAQSKSLYDLLGKAANTLARYHNYKGQHDSAIYYYELGLKNFALVKDTAEEAGIYNNIGNVYKNTGRIDKALEYYYKSLKLKEAMRDVDAEASSCTNLAHLYHQQGDSVNALKFFNRALAIRELQKDSNELMNLFVIIANFYRDKGNFKKAEFYLKPAVNYLAHSEDGEGAAIAGYNYANLLFAQGRHAESGVLYASVLKAAEKMGNAEGMASCLEMLGQVEMELKNYKRAVEFYERAVVSAREAQLPDLLSTVFGGLSVAYERVGDYPKAYSTLKDGIGLRDSLFNAENIKKATAAELNYIHEKEKISAQLEHQKKEAIQIQENFRKNIMLAFSIVFLIAVSVFAAVLTNRLRLIRAQKSLIQEQNREILDSIKYAKRIQNALMANKRVIDRNLRSSFIFFRPRNLVSGDFYWAHEHEERFYLAVCDSTGHGVPGAFMSLLNIGFLNEALVEKKLVDPGQIFDHVRERLIASMGAEGQKDGMDGILLCFDKKERAISYAASNNHPVIVREGALIEFPYDKMPVGKGELERNFTTFELPVEASDMVYLYTDGYADQFGGAKGKKFMYKQLNLLLTSIASQQAESQETALDARFEEWKGNLEQVDDVCVFGIKI